MSWNCTQIEERLSDFLDGALSAEERQEFSAHAATCLNCAPLVRHVSDVVAGMQSLEELEVPPQLIPNILEQTLGKRRTRAISEAGRGWRAWLPTLWQPRFAAGALSLATAAAMLIYMAGALPSRASKKTPWNPMEMMRAVNRNVHLTYARGAKFVNDLRVVYEIQTRLRTEAPPASESAPGSSPSNSAPQQKSERKSHAAPVAGTSGEVLAFLRNDPLGRQP